ncbi:MAG: hypothetical protein K6E33_03200 [Lachnospiraceae bacterium]|nr:hypothetical protein [Lachnospiraceae bacterium]
MPYGSDWYKLDNVAKIMPSTATGADTRVFRLVCELVEDVDHDVLQDALDDTIEDFPLLRCCLRRGLFWYYLEQTQIRPLVTQDTLPALSVLYIPGRHNLLFRVTYNKNRINVEMYHVIADGTGGYSFIKHLIMNYLSKKYSLDLHDYAPDMTSVSERASDAYSRYYGSGEKAPALSPLSWIKKMIPANACKIKGIPDPDLREHLLEGRVSLSEFLDVCHQKNLTLGIMSTSLFIIAVLKQLGTREMKKPIVISVPVNLRQFFPSETARNFFGTIFVRYDPKKYDGTLESVTGEVAKAFKSELTKERVANAMNSYAILEHAWGIKILPLSFKNLAVHFFNSNIKSGVTASVSNVGKIELPEEASKYVKFFSSFMAGPTVFMCISTFGDEMSFGIVDAYTRHDVSLEFFRSLTAMGMHVTLSSNDSYMDEH